MISFDIFDTVITRKTVLPVGTFLIMQKRFEKKQLELGKSLVDNFSNLRISAENSARVRMSSCGLEEVNIDEIYNELAKMTGISREITEGLKNIEIEVETENLLPCVQNIQLLKRYRKRGEKVILISDMYLYSTVLRSMLTTIDNVFASIPIYVSCEYGKTKASGRLYGIVREMENIDCREWIHYGDNSVSDVSMPGLMGIRTRHYKGTGMERWEKEISDKCNLRWNLELQTFLGMAGYARQDKRLSMNARIGLSIGGLALYPYVVWILRKCNELDINRLYFIARDGYVIKAMMDKVISNCGYNVRTTYFYGSRLAWNIGNDRERRGLISRYIAQEIDFSDHKFAFIDVQGTGQTFERFCEIMKDFADEPIKIFYYDFMGNNELQNCEVHAFFSNQECAMCESICRAPHDVTIGYHVTGDKVVPVLHSADQEKWKKCGVKDFVIGASLFADIMSKNEYPTEINIESQQLVIEIMGYLSDKPCEAVLDYLAGIPHGDIGAESESIYAPRLSYMDILKLFFYRTDEDVKLFYKGTNLEFSLKRLNDTQRKFLTWCQKARFRAPGIMMCKLKRHLCKSGYIKQKKLPKIILYGAGEYGRRLYSRIASVDPQSIVAWVDIKSSKYQEQGYPVRSPRCVLNAEYEYLVLTMKSEDSRENVRDMLLQTGLSKDKILSADEYCQNILND